VEIQDEYGRTRRYQKGTEEYKQHKVSPRIPGAKKPPFFSL
jgi:hypothetical protein